MKIRRGDILYVDLGVQYQGSIQGSMRPVVVVSNNMGEQAQHRDNGCSLVYQNQQKEKSSHSCICLSL
mgnify:CR=1 FL=1